MGSQGPGRKRTPNRNGLTAEEDALNIIAREAETRLAAKRAARAEAREIRMRELERQQKEIYQVQKKYYGFDSLNNKWGNIEQWMEDSERCTHQSQRPLSEMSDDEERTTVESRGNIQDNSSNTAASFLGDAASSSCLSRDLQYVTIPDLPNSSRRLLQGSSQASTTSAATLISLGETSLYRGSGDPSATTDTQASIEDIKDLLSEMEEKYRKAMVSNSHLDNEKSTLMYQVDTLKENLTEMEELLSETRRELEENVKDLEREKLAHSVLQFKFDELEKTVKQSEELHTEIHQLRLREAGFLREVSDLKETIEWKNKKIGALERQKDYSDAIRNERDELRDDVVQLRDIVKKHGIVLGPDLSTRREVEDVTDRSPCTEQGNSVLGTQEMGRDENVSGCNENQDENPKYLDHGIQENSLSPRTCGSSLKRALATQKDDCHLGNDLNRDLKQIQNVVEQSQNVVENEAVMSTQTIKVKEENVVVSEYLEGEVGKVVYDPLPDVPTIADKNKSLGFVTEEMRTGKMYLCEAPLVSLEHEYLPSEKIVVESQDPKAEEQARTMDLNAKKTHNTSNPSKKKKKKKKSKQKQCCDVKESIRGSGEKNKNKLKAGSLFQNIMPKPHCNNLPVDPSEEMTVNEKTTVNLNTDVNILPVNIDFDSSELLRSDSRTDISSCDVLLSFSKTETSLKFKDDKGQNQVEKYSAEIDGHIIHLDERKEESVKSLKVEKETQREQTVLTGPEDVCHGNDIPQMPTSIDLELKVEKTEVKFRDTLEYPLTDAAELPDVITNCSHVKIDMVVTGSKNNSQEKAESLKEQESDVACSTAQEDIGKTND
ncbi:leucine-rich repeat flightless-interacting protein 1 isoform X3 [Hoplias malabaricus]|uniref:leucine-rich repeat flightless-interacting protein 1 isoform X3 n=1 Tax=Hoplias malabaricus TaxID=27720 RepID=UPI003462C777